MSRIRIIQFVTLVCLSSLGRVKSQDAARAIELANNIHGIVWWADRFRPDSMSTACKDDLIYWADNIYNETDWAWISK